MFYYLELHNHTDESDGSLSPRALLDFMKDHSVHGFAVTDHNTTSAHRKLKKLLPEGRSAPSCIYGLEYTTYYGHVLCFFQNEYLSWETLNPGKPEPFFQKLRSLGGIVGIAHPFSADAPLTNGCRFHMNITDYNVIDFIEIINNSEPMLPVNNSAVSWWESLVLQGYHIAMTTGLDLHQPVCLCDTYSTFIKNKPGVTLTDSFRDAMQAGQTYISRGPILELCLTPDSKSIQLHLTDSPRQTKTAFSCDKYYITLTSNRITLTVPWDFRVPYILPLEKLSASSVIIGKLYEGDVAPAHLIAIAPPLYLPQL